MSAITREILRDELENFAKETIRGELERFKSELMSELFAERRTRGLPAISADREKPRSAPDGDKPSSKSARTATDNTSKGSYTLLSTYLQMEDQETTPSQSKSFKVGSEETALHEFVHSSAFKIFIMTTIFLNTAVFVVQADYMARYWTDNPPLVFFVLELVFLLIFAGEITLRIIEAGRSFFTSKRKAQHNWFDLSLVVLQVCEVVLMLHSEFSVGAHRNSHMAGALRIVRCSRIFRVGRLLYLVPSLHMLVTSIVASFESLLWIMSLVFLTTGIFAVVITEVVTEHKIAAEGAEAPGQEELEDNFGTVDRTMLRLYQAMTDGLHWAELADPLMTYISPWACTILIIYSAFVNFALMNIVTAFFVETAMSEAQSDYQMLMSKVLWKSFHMVDMNSDREVSEQEFMASLGNPAMSDYLAKLGVDEAKAHDMDFFKLLDKDNNGSLSGNELMMECIKLLGPARAVDLASLVRAVKEEQKLNREQWRYVQEALDLMHERDTSGLTGVAQQA